MNKLIKENILYIVIVIIVLFGGIYTIYHNGAMTVDTFSQMSAKQAEMQTKVQKLEQIKAERVSGQKKKSTAQSGKVIYAVPINQFSPAASFGIMFENVITNITNSGLKVRSIDYNYSPSDDKVLTAQVEGYNACELTFTTVGSYTQLQTFFKNIAKEKYLSSLYEVYIEPYDKDKSILIAKFKIRLYTKSV